MESFQVFFEKYYSIFLEAAKDKINRLKISDPWTQNFIYRYENLIDWNSTKSEKDVNEQISGMVDNLIKDRESLYTKNINWERELDILKGQAEQGNDEAAQVISIYERNPEGAQKQLLNTINSDKERVFQSWIDYIVNDGPYKDNPAFQYVILRGIFSLTGEKKRNPPPGLAQNIVADMYEEIGQSPEKTLGVGKVYNRMYKDFIDSQYESIESSNETNWIKILSKQNDPKNYEKNLDTLSSLGCNTNWCVANRSAADYYLKDGDFYILYKNINGQDRGVAAIAMRGNNIREIRGTEEGQSISHEYLENVKDLIDKEGLSGNDAEIERLERQLNMKRLETIKKRLETEDTVEVDGNLDLSNTLISKLPENLSVDGYLHITGKTTLKLPNNLSVDGVLSLRGTQISKLPDNLSVGGSIDLSNSMISELPDNLNVNGNLFLSDTPISKLPDGLNVVGSLFLNGTSISELPNDLSIGVDLDLEDTPISKLPSNLNIPESLNLLGTSITELPNNLSVGDNLDLTNTPISKLPDDLSVGGDLVLYASPISKKYTEEEIRKMVKHVGGEIFM